MESGSTVDWRRSRRLAVVIAGLAGLAAFAWLAWRGADQRAILGNMDVLYHVHRIDRCLSDFPHVTSLDTYSHFGRPWQLHWLAPFTLLHAVIAKLAGVEPGDLRALVGTLSWLPPIMGALAAALTAWLAWWASRDTLIAALAGLAMAFSGDALIVFHHGALDHHSFAAMGLLVVTLGRVRSSWGTWLIGWLLMLAFTPEATPYATLGLGVLASVEIVGRLRSLEGILPRPTKWLLAPALAASLAWLAQLALDPAANVRAFNIFEVSAFQPAWLAALGGGAALAVALARPGRTGRALAALGMSVIAAGALLLMTGQAPEIVERLTKSQRLQVGEELSLLRFIVQARDTHWGAWASLLVMLAVFLAARWAFSWRRRDNVTVLFTCTVLASSAALALVELRHARALAGLIALGLALLLVEGCRALSGLPMLSNRAGRLGVGALLTLAVIPSLLWHSIEVRAAIRTPNASAKAIEELAAWLSTSTPPAGPRDAPPPYGVFAPWEWGHHVNLLGGRPVIVDGFNHEDVDAQSREVWLAESADDLVARLTSLGARYFVVTNAGGAILGLLPSAPFERARKMPQVPGGLAYLPSMERFAAFRLNQSLGLSPEFGRLAPRFLASDDRPLVLLRDAPMLSNVPRVLCFEVVPGALVTGHAPEGATSIDVLYRMHGRWPAQSGTPLDDSWTRTSSVPVDPDGSFSLRVALPTTPSPPGSLQLDLLTLRAAGREAVVAVTEDDVANGRSVAATFP